MSHSLSYDELIALEPCDAPERKYLFRNAERLTAREALAAGAPISDLIWVANRLGLQRECVQFALACAQRVAHLNADPRVQGALDAAQAWLDNPSDSNAAVRAAAKSAAANAANAAYAYADANVAAAYAANAVKAANHAAYAKAPFAAYVATAAANAAYANADANAYADTAKYREAIHRLAMGMVECLKRVPA